MKTVAVIQARMGSTRLPGKVLMPLLGAPMLTRVVERTRRAMTVDEVVVATTTHPADDVIAAIGGEHAWPVVRGSEMDLLDRYVAAARAHDADVIVRITSDCPLVDPELVDAVVRRLAADAADYASDTLPPRTVALGLDVEAMTRATLERADAEDQDPTWREHVTPYIYRHPERFRLTGVALPEDLSGYRWCVDTADDLEVVRRIYEALGTDRFGWRDVLEVVRANPDWALLNAHVQQRTVPG